MNDELISELDITVPEVSTRQCKLTLTNTDDTTSGIAYYLKGYKIFDTMISKSQFVEYYSGTLQSLPTSLQWTTINSVEITNYLNVTDVTFKNTAIIIAEQLEINGAPHAYLYTVTTTSNFTENDVTITPLWLVNGGTSKIRLPGEYFNSKDQPLT